MFDWNKTLDFFKNHIFLGKSLKSVPEGSLILFPYDPNHLSCGLTGLLAFKKKQSRTFAVEALIEEMETICKNIVQQKFSNIIDQSGEFDKDYLGGNKRIQALWNAARQFKRKSAFATIFQHENLYKSLKKMGNELETLVAGEIQSYEKEKGRISKEYSRIISQSIEDIKDVNWCIQKETLRNIDSVRDLMNIQTSKNINERIDLFKQINTVLNSIDRLEVRGRDSAGISLLFILSQDQFKAFESEIANQGLNDVYDIRKKQAVLENGNIRIFQQSDTKKTITFTYKVAAEIGSLGDNIRFIRNQISKDSLFQTITGYPNDFFTVSAHTRWASVGEINVCNCHPAGNDIKSKSGIIHVCLNGDIDNYLLLKKDIESEFGPLSKMVTTDTQIIPMQIEKYLCQNESIEEAIRKAVNDFDGSHAISIHTDLAPGKMFLAQKGSGQTIFIGIGAEHYIPTSEVYGFVEETSSYIKMDGEKQVQGKDGLTQGQLFELNQNTLGGLEGIRGCYYDGTSIEITDTIIQSTNITSRDIDRQTFPHYFLKEISESPFSVEKTIEHRWAYQSIDGEEMPVIQLGQKTIPQIIQKAFENKRIHNISFIGQGTAGVAALACANILQYYLSPCLMNVSAYKSSEFSGFMLEEEENSNELSHTLVVAISQSGTTADTNRTIDMVKAKGAYTLAIVNRRDSDITFKVDGVMYTSSGRDIEMSVASTKAFYSQIVAGALIGLELAKISRARSYQFIANEIRTLTQISDCMREVLSQSKAIEQSAKDVATTRNHWAVVGSGPNKAAADEIRIKLSELCYKIISSDYVEDKKHIDLSSEPLIIICAAGCKESVLSDIIKDTAIFKAHKAIPLVVVDKGEKRFETYARTVFHVPKLPQHFSPILNTLFGHLWGYYAALAINENSRFLFDFKEEVTRYIEDCSAKNIDIYEILLEKSFREMIANFYNEFRLKKREHSIPLIMGLEVASDITLLMKYLTGRLPVRDFELDFGVKGTPKKMLETLYECLGKAINNMARPIDAIKHQAKTVTVGTSRISEKMEGLLFEIVQKRFSLDQLINKNVIVLKNLQNVVENIEGSVLYKVGGLNVLGEPTEDSYLEVIEKQGSSQEIDSRFESDKKLKGIKRIIVRQGNVFIGKGRADRRKILIIPIISASPNTSHMIENILLLNISLKQDVDLETKIRALGEKCEHIKNIVQESNVIWQNDFLDLLPVEDLFGQSAEKIAESIVGKI
ncbi:glutamine--fructose-6-phosphate aminotransferase [Candidatus Magnetomorum sp. HK-1]|nr:glutamine--fructose-6-phosphate aminotransferase [Candidatus Magnetomorum sp. HK-1]